MWHLSQNLSHLQAFAAESASDVTPVTPRVVWLRVAPDDVTLRRATAQQHRKHLRNPCRNCLQWCRQEREFELRRDNIRRGEAWRHTWRGKRRESGWVHCWPSKVRAGCCWVGSMSCEGCYLKSNPERTSARRSRGGKDPSRRRRRARLLWAS